jgi:hypothetical protein
MSDTWGSYTSDTNGTDPGTSVSEVVDLAPQLDVAAVEQGQSDAAVGWGDWNAATTHEYVADAQGEIAYAQEAYASGWDEVGDAAMARAGASLDVAADHAETADGYYATADSYASAADQELTLAEDSVGTSTYDTGSYDTGSYDTASYDTAAADTSSYASDSGE